MRFIWTVVSLALVFLVFYLGLSIVVDGYFDGNIFPNEVTPDSWAAPNSWSNWRDILIVFTALFWVLSGIVLVILLIILVVVALAARRVLTQNVAPAVDSLKDSLDNLRGTTEFMGETVVSPVIRVYAVVRGVRGGIGAITHLPDRIRRRKKGKK
jgi:hypothetical protein